MNFSKTISQPSGKRMALFTKAAGVTEHLCIQTAIIASLDRNLTSHTQYQLKTCHQFKWKTIKLLVKKGRQKYFGRNQSFRFVRKSMIHKRKKEYVLFQKLAFSFSAIQKTMSRERTRQSLLSKVWEKVFDSLMSCQGLILSIKNMYAQGKQSKKNPSSWNLGRSINR